MRNLWVAVTFTLLAWAVANPCSAENQGPWSSNRNSPAFERLPSHSVQSASSVDNPAARLLVGAVRFFQRHISPVDGDRCSMTPTCSHYSLQAIGKHGALMGFVMSADRIVHEYDEQRFVPALWDGRRYRFYDPVENNDFWFASPVSSQGGE